MIRLGIIAAVSVTVGLVIHPLFGVATFVLGVIRVYR